jgi:hypothetical protein
LAAKKVNIDIINDSSNDELSFDENDSSIELDSNIAEFESDLASTDRKKSKHANKRNFNAMRKIEQLQEERRLRKLNEDFYDDWD